MEIKNKGEQNKSNEFFKFSGDWSKQSKALKVKYPKLTEEDVKFETGKETDLFKRLETKLDKNRSEVIGILRANYQATI
ncbi:hypothetical protein [Tenacibaculum caenipelagi]|uniref:General stress protein CsbD n=1 Tax=Tenacibaculum caenipelagi TaxID=1325435 RepID=A0A4R6TCM2_9FLAO|nr:hypothetical protein [Tenacibaculum caenipelagi]TDQ25773.1 hypothetical protein DFQ07_2204 [Tenacibaculum caenipelagi]